MLSRERNRRKHMHRLLVRGFFPFVIGASLLAGCATKDEFRTTQSTADAARMQADEARAAADRAVAAAQAAQQRADQASTTAQQAQQTANSAQTSANTAQSSAQSAQSSAQSAATSAEQAKDDAQAAQEKVQEASRPRGTRLARGERGFIDCAQRPAGQRNIGGLPLHMQAVRRHARVEFVQRRVGLGRTVT